MSEAAVQCFEIFSYNSLKKHLWCSPNISKIFNRPPENRFNNRQYATHIEQLIDALDNLCVCIFCTKTDLLAFPVIRRTFDYIERRS